MTNIGDVLRWVNAVKQSYVSVIPPAVVEDLSEFFENLPLELDLASAGHYLRKEFKRNDTGVDDRIQIFTFDPEPADDEGYWDSSGYDSDDDYDDDASWREDYY